MSVKMAGQTMTDRLLAARHSIAGQGLAKSVCKATTEELIGPKKKHLDYLIHCTNEPNVSIPQLANLLIERSQNTNWVVVFKALITVHHMMCYGNERFTQYLASSNSTFQLSNFLDKSGVQGARVGYDMSPFIRRYAKYLNEKAMSYRTVAFDFCKVKRGKEDGVLRTMNAEKLLKTLPALQAQLDALLEFDCTPTDLSNGVINMAFMLLFRDLIRLFAGYNDSIINLLEKYFDMNKKQCREALDLYKKFLIRMDRVGEFLKVAENVGIDKGEIPDLTKAPSSLLDALEQHLAALEGKKGSAANTPTQSASHRTDVKSGVTALNSTSSAFGSAAQNAEGVEETLRQQALAEEEAAINHYKAKVQSPTNSGASSTNPFLISSPTQPIVDLFGAPAAPSDMNQTTKASDDLLQLGNPFADFGAPTNATVPTTAPPANAWMSNGFNNSAVPATNAFVSDTAFSSVFGSNEPAANAAPAAGPGVPSSAPNPFMADFGPPSSVPEPETAPDQGADLFGDNQGGAVDLFELGDQEAAQQPKSDDAAALKTATPPPPRPPPPRTASPGMGKSAFDDLNDSIRMALGGSPSRPPLPSQQQQPQQPVQQQTQPNPLAGFDPMTACAGQPPVMAYASPVPPTCAPMYGSPVKSGMAKPVTPTANYMTFMYGQDHNAASMSSNKVLTGDLDSSLASLAENLTINKGAQPNKGVQWNSPKNTAKPGGPTGWSPQPMAATTGANYRPMGQGMTSTMPFPTVQTMGMGGMRMPQPGPGVVMGSAAPGMGSPRQMPPPGATPPPLDPFGAL